MITALFITTDGDFSIVLEDSVQCGDYGYVLTTELPIDEYLSGLLGTMGLSPTLHNIIEHYFSDPSDYIEYGNYSMSLELVDTSKEEMLKAAELMSGFMKT